MRLLIHISACYRKQLITLFDLMHGHSMYIYIYIYIYIELCYILTCLVPIDGKIDLMGLVLIFLPV